jgi:phage repressor protein C with HTH and peptisase S24 domain
VFLHNTRRCYIQTMTDKDSNIGTMVRTARLDHKLSQPELARRVGTTQQTIEKIELGKIKHSSFMPAIAQELNIAIDKVVRNPRPLAAPLKLVPGEKLTGNNDLAVYAAVQGGSGVLILSSDPVEYVVRPDPLARVRDGYGVIVVEDSMKPEFRSGDIALVNPHLPPRAGDTCVFRHQEEDGTETAIIKHLRRATAERWLVTEWNSDDGEHRDFELDRSEWQKCHVTVGKYSRR